MLDKDKRSWVCQNRDVKLLLYVVEMVTFFFKQSGNSGRGQKDSVMKDLKSSVLPDHCKYMQFRNTCSFWDTTAICAQNCS